MPGYLFRKCCFLLLFMLPGAFYVSAQTCSIQVSEDKICAGRAVVFIANTTGGTVVSCSWDFGDGFSGINDTSTHTYIAWGNFTPSVKVHFVSGDSCTAIYPLVKVFPLPVSKFAITTSDTMCYKGNELCVLDLSTPGPANAPVFKRVYQLSNGYSQIDFVPYPSSIICYQDSVDFALGHLFSLVLEVTDTNNCVSRLEKKDSVLLYKKMQIKFDAQYSISCFNTPVSFVNQSSLLPSEVKKFYWVFDDGEVDSTNWAGPMHNYTQHGAFRPYMVVTSTDNCTDTALWPYPISSIFPDSILYFDSVPNRCFRNNIYKFSTHNDPFYARTFWNFYDINNIEVFPFVIEDQDTAIRVHFENCGVYTVRMTIKFPNCITVTDSVFTVYGPKAVIEKDPTVPVTNRDQCAVHDTVYFISPNPYLSCQAGNSNMIHIWDFGDPFAPPCTTDTRHGVNVGINCNFSRDTVNVKHFYTPGKDDCYKASLYMKDSLLGCYDEDTVSIALTPPSAHWDSTVTPIRRGLYYDGIPCLGVLLKFMFDETLPTCGYEKLWLNFDSACDKNDWHLVDEPPINRFLYHSYDSTCDQVDGYVTLGMIVKNGNCYDTAWYHNMLQMRPIIPFIKLSLDLGCSPYNIRARLVDSIQYDIDNVRWGFGGGWYNGINDLRNSLGVGEVNLLDTPRWQLLLPPDSVIHSQVFSADRKGVYSVSIAVRNKLQCSRVDKVSIGVGYFDDFEVSRNKLCVGDTITLSDFIRYYNPNSFKGIDGINFWADPARAAAGKEQVWWDIGDGKGFSYTGSQPLIQYDKPGQYTITMLVRDSLGCFDTLIKPGLLNVTALDVNIGTLQDNYFCAPQIVIFKDSSMVVDTTGSTVPSFYDYITSRSWNFGDHTVESLLEDPAHNYTKNGTFETILRVTSSLGCIDYDTATVTLKGPLPMFTIEDTIGCAPFHVQFHNTTGKQMKNWTWYFGDQGNHTLTTLNDSDVFFTYPQPGIYSIKLLAIEDVFNPSTGNTIICPASFPDSVTQLPSRKVYVLPVLPVSLLSEDTVCVNTPLKFIAVSDPGYSSYRWDFGDGGLASHHRPDTTATHTYAEAGTYNVWLVPKVSNGYECLDSATTTVCVSGVSAAFEIDSTEIPVFHFPNKSLMGSRYLWEFGRPDKGAANQSTEFNGLFNYGTDTGTFIICLTAFNDQDCSDSVCKPITLARLDKHLIIPNVFTPDNNDGKNDAFDIDILGFDEYHLQVYNRWGTEVYQSDKDGIGNDGTNWNGRDHNRGKECAEGVYYFIFTYSFISEQSSSTVHGTITLIRDK